MRFVTLGHDILLFKHYFNYFYCHHLCEEGITLNGLMIRTGFLNNNNNSILYLFTIKSGTSAPFTGDYKIGKLLRNIKMFLREINKK